MIASVQQARDFINTSLSDEQLEQKLVAIELFIRKITKNNFQLREIRSVSAVSNQLILTPPTNLDIGDTFQITQSRFNNGIFTVSQISNMGLKTNKSLISCTHNLITKVYYPTDIVVGTLELLKWNINHSDKIGIHSEKLSRYSITYSEGSDKIAFGYPINLTAFLKPYMKARF